jgi:hypothetical protein
MVTNMICPECASEYREGYTRCEGCDVDLVELVVEERPPDVELVKVYETGNAAIIPVLESVLNDGGIEYMAKGEPIQDLFGWGRLGTNMNYVIGPVEFYVRKDDEDEARALVQTLESANVVADEGDVEEPRILAP